MCTRYIDVLSYKTQCEEKGSNSQVTRNCITTVFRYVQLTSCISLRPIKTFRLFHDVWFLFCSQRWNHFRRFSRHGRSKTRDDYQEFPKTTCRGISKSGGNDGDTAWIRWGSLPWSKSNVNNLLFNANIYYYISFWTSTPSRVNSIYHNIILKCIKANFNKSFADDID